MSASERTKRARDEVSVAQLSDAVAVPLRFEVSGQAFTLLAYYVIDSSSNSPAADFTRTGDAASICKLYKKEGGLLSKHYPDYPPLPYALFQADGTFFGDFTTAKGAKQFNSALVELGEGEFKPPQWAQRLWRFVRLKKPRVFTLDEEKACVSAVRQENGAMVFSLAPQRHSQVVYSMNSESEKFSVTRDDIARLQAMETPQEDIEELKKLSASLQEEYPGASTVRDVILVHTEGKLPVFEQEIYTSALGVAGIVLTADDDLVFVKRGNGTGVNHGINVTASGGAVLDEHGRNDLKSHCNLQTYVARQMQQEAQTEIGLSYGDVVSDALQDRLLLELGIEEVEYNMVPLAMVRELPRGGSPEFLSLIVFHGTTKELISRIRDNPYPDKKEIDGFVYTMPLSDARRLVHLAAAQKVLHHKALVTLIFIDRFFINHPVPHLNSQNGAF